MYMIKSKDYHLHLINVAIPDFLNAGPALEGVQQIESSFHHAAEEEATPSQPTIKEEEEEIVEVLESKDDFKVFNQPQFLEVLASDFSHLPPAQVTHTQEALIVLDAMVLQCKTRSSLLDLLESHAEGNVPEKAVQPKPPTPPSG